MDDDGSSSVAPFADYRDARVPHLTLDQERILADIVRAGHSATPNLRLAVIPIEAVLTLEVGAMLAGISRRAQHQLQRSAAQWIARRGERDALTRALEALARYCETHELVEQARRVRLIAGAQSPALLIGALRLERELCGELRDAPVSKDFGAVLESELARLDRSVPPSELERLDAQRAVRLARDLLVRSQLPLVLRRASKVRRYSALAFDDLVQIGTIALMQAVENFDPRVGAPLAAYVMPWVKVGILRGERTSGVISLPGYVRDARRKIYKLLGDPSLADASPAYLAQRLSLSQILVERVLRERGKCLSLDRDDQRALLDVCADDSSLPLEEHVRLRERREAVQCALAMSTPRERDIVSGIYGIGREPEPVVTIAKRHGLTPQRVYQIRDEELRRLRRPAVSQLLAQYL